MPSTRSLSILCGSVFLSLAIGGALPGSVLPNAEQACFDAVQGKVAWNRAGAKTWQDQNVRRLCKGTTNPSATIACFQAQIAQHDDWSRAIDACSAGAATTPTPSGGGLRVLTHNTYLINVGAPAKTERRKAIQDAPYLRGYDVIVFDELFNDDESVALLDALKAEYPYQTGVINRQSASDPACAGNDRSCWNESVGRLKPLLEDGGVAIVSRHPIEKKVQVLFETSCGEDALANKGFAYARINRNGEKIHVVGTHLQAVVTLDEVVLAVYGITAGQTGTVAKPCGDDGRSARTAQFRQIRDFLRGEGIPASEPVIIGGDLNVVSGSSEYEAMFASLGARRPRWKPGSHAATWDPATNEILAYKSPNAKGELLDYLLLSADHADIPGWTSSVVVTCPSTSWTGLGDDKLGNPLRVAEYSDHYPVAAGADASALPGTDPRCTAPISEAFYEGVVCTAGGSGCQSPRKCLLGARGVARCSTVDGRWPLQVDGCSVAANCPTGHYCPVGNGACEPAKPDGAACLPGQDNWCLSGKCGSNSTCLTKVDGKYYTSRHAATGCSVVHNCEPGYYCVTAFQACKRDDPCRCKATGAWGTLCGDWDASGYRWCYVKDPAACRREPRAPTLTESSGGDDYWKKCTGND